MSRTLSLLTAVVFSLLLITLAACSGDKEEKGTETPAKPTATTAAQTATKPSGATPTEAATGTPIGPGLSGSATATVKVGDKTLTFRNGRCEKILDDAWLAVSIGQPGSDEYFGLGVGANPGAPEGARPVRGGGVFIDGEIGLAGTQGGVSFAMGGAEGNKVTVAADLQSGEFVGTTVDGQAISGSFKC